jgi:hypothetical protein
MNARDRQVARETVRARSECPACNPPSPRREDRAPIDVSQLPPWPCCGRRGPHSPSCPHPSRVDHDRAARVEES